MLCSVCKKNAAVIFINRSDEPSQMEGLCYECAKKKGINPLDALAKQANLSESDLENMSKQFESMFNDMSENPEFAEEADKILGEESGNNLGAIFSGLFGNQQESESSNSTKKVKTEKKSNKKHKALDNFGTNLTYKAKNNQLDMVIGRDKELARVIQILNRRTK